MRRIVLIHYNEIALKGRNRPFLSALCSEISNARLPATREHRERSSRRMTATRESSERSSHRMMVALLKKRGLFSGGLWCGLKRMPMKAIAEKLNKVFGIANFSLVGRCHRNFQKFQMKCLRF